MRLYPADEIASMLPWHPLVDALREQFQREVVSPVRHHHEIGSPGILLLMPAWTSGPGGLAGVKLVTVYPQNPASGHPSIQGQYLLFDTATGTPLAVMDAATITLHRTAAASVLAASYLARKDSRRLLLCSTGRLAPYIARAYAAVLGIDSVRVWGRKPERTAALAASLSAEGLEAEAVGDPNEALGWADIVTCATMSHTPLFDGHRLRPGTHVDLIGGFTYDMRESDDETIRRSRVYVDTREGALAEAGDLLQPIATGVFRPEDVVGDLFDLCRGVVKGRVSDEEITLFKSVGCALEDLAAAELVYRDTRNSRSDT
ncbi:MAG: ornithine cyclodeaminase family protein [Rhodothermales bacterium]|nr:ornithine cyclodeaminase family protein [Rhodothermales bacterium]